jgi:hypothetical protein
MPTLFEVMSYLLFSLISNHWSITTAVARIEIVTILCSWGHFEASYIEEKEKWTEVFVRVESSFVWAEDWELTSSVPFASVP